MDAEYWFILAIAVVAALGLGFAAGRMSAPTQRRVQEMEKERDAARTEAETVRKEVNRHFEESARMFGKLASDYRSFFQQFARTAQNLGLSDGQARELLQQADPSLVTSDGAAKRAPAKDDAGTATAPADAAATATANETPVEKKAETSGTSGDSGEADQGGAPDKATEASATGEGADTKPAREPEDKTSEPESTDESEPEKRPTN